MLLELVFQYVTLTKTGLFVGLLVWLCYPEIAETLLRDAAKEQDFRYILALAKINTQI